MPTKSKYPQAIKDITIIIDRLLTDEVTMTGMAAEYNVPYHTMRSYVLKNATIRQHGTISKRGLEVAGRLRRGIANNPSGESKPNSKANQFGKTYADPLSPVRHRIVRPTFEVQTKGADGKWYHLDFPTCEDAAVLLLGRLYCYNLITQADYNEQESV